MFTQTTTSYTVDGYTLDFTTHHDDDADAPWDREDGHGPVSGWRRAGHNGHASKAPGERPLSIDRDGSARFYDFAKACRMARRDGWGLSDEAQAKLIAQLAAPKRRAVKSEYHVANGIRQDRITKWQTIPGRDPNKPLTAGEIAAAAAQADYDRLRGWCDDQWHYVGVAVTVSRNGIRLTGDYDHAVWGIESDAGAYLAETANELAADALAAAREAVAGLVDA